MFLCESIKKYLEEFLSLLLLNDNYFPGILSAVQPSPTWITWQWICLGRQLECFPISLKLSLILVCLFLVPGTGELLFFIILG